MLGRGPLPPRAARRRGNAHRRALENVRNDQTNGYPRGAAKGFVGVAFRPVPTHLALIHR